MEQPTERPPAAPAAATARHVVLGFGVRELGLGIVALAVLVALGVWSRQRAKTDREELAAIRAQLAVARDAADLYHDGYATVQTNSAQLRAWAASEGAEPVRVWARERVKLFDRFAAQLDHETEARAFATGATDVERLLAKGDLEGARARLKALPLVTFPTPAELRRLRHDAYEAPLAQFSRQNPESYRALRQYEPEASRQDEQALRAELAAAGPENVTPQVMMNVDLLAAVAAPDDPVVAEWSALTSAMDYFDHPDGATLGRWRRAQHALQVKDWPTATNEMQAILLSKVRTRQPFRAAYGRALFQRNPDNPEAAYPFLAEAAAAGDRRARTWVAEQDAAHGRLAQAQRWLEAAVADGDPQAVPLLVKLYEQHPEAADRDHQIGLLERVTDRAESPASAALLLGRLYEAKDPAGAAKAAAFFQRAAAKGSAAASAEVARCALGGIGMAQNLDQARDAACRAFAAGEREASVPTLLELLRRAPERSAGAILQLFAEESVVQGGGYMERRFVDGPGVSQLRSALARYLDQNGKLGDAARLYARSTDAAGVGRYGELTASHPCQTCGGSGRVQVMAPCPACGGKGRQQCGFCGGTGVIFVPGTPPCTTCGGTGTIVQDRRVVACSACGGTGKGKGSVIKQDCSHCDHGYIPCPECGGTGAIKVTKECPECHGRGTWTLVDRGGQ